MCAVECVVVCLLLVWLRLGFALPTGNHIHQFVGMSVAELIEPLYARDEPAVTTFGFRLPNFYRERSKSSSRRGQCASPAFKFGPFRWCIEVHPNGNALHVGRAVSVYLAAVTKLPQNVSIQLPFSITVLRTDGGDPGTHVVKGSVDAGAAPHVFSSECKRIGWPDVIPLDEIGAFLDKADGLIVHVAMGKPAKCCFDQVVNRSVIGGEDVFDTPAFALAGRYWFLRINPCIEDEGSEDKLVSLHVFMDNNTTVTDTSLLLLTCALLLRVSGSTSDDAVIVLMVMQESCVWRELWRHW